MTVIFPMLHTEATTGSFLCFWLNILCLKFLETINLLICQLDIMYLIDVAVYKQDKKRISQESWGIPVLKNLSSKVSLAGE